MSDPGDKLARLGEILHVDDTAPVERPQRGIGRLLGIPEDTSDDPPDDSTAKPPDEPASPAEPAAEPPRPTQPAVTPRRAAPTRPQRAPRTPAAGRPTGLTHRSTALLPTRLGAALDDAKAQRWSVTDLIAAAIERSVPSEADAEAVLARYTDDVRGLRSYTLPTDTIDRLDTIGEGWRMNRSQVLTVLAARELEQRGFHPYGAHEPP